MAVALSADGNTAIAGEPFNADEAGGAWIFTRSGGTWTQQGGKLLGSDPALAYGARQGYAVSLSADGNTALVGGYLDNQGVGAGWVFTRSNGVWTQQGPKLVGSGAVGPAYQGYAVSLSADGDTALIGGLGDSNNSGAAWVFTRSGGVWSQYGSKLVGSGAVGAARQGASVALSGDGRTALLGGFSDNNNLGATWPFVLQPVSARSGAHDFSGDGRSDLALRSASSGVPAIWLVDSGTITATAGFPALPLSYTLAGQRDFDGDGRADWLWRGADGDTAIWFLNGAGVKSSVALGVVPPAWTIAGTGDFNGDGKGDILWYDTSANVALWLMDGPNVIGTTIYNSGSTAWSVAGVGDFNGDGKSDVLWRNTQGYIAFWFMDGLTRASAALIGPLANAWTIVGTGDFDGDGKTDILFRDTGGAIAIWLMDGASVKSSAVLGALPLGFVTVETGDFNGDGKSDILWRDISTGATAIWFMDGVTVANSSGVPNPGTDWVMVGQNAD